MRIIEGTPDEIRALLGMEAKTDIIAVEEEPAEAEFQGNDDIEIIKPRKMHRKWSPRSCQKWTPEEESTLMLLLDQGKNDRQIAKVLQRSTTAVHVHRKYDGKFSNAYQRHREAVIAIPKIFQPKPKRKGHMQQNPNVIARLKYVGTHSQLLMRNGMTRKEAFIEANRLWKMSKQLQ